MAASKIDQLPLTDEQRSEIQFDLASEAVSHAAIVRKFRDWGYEIGETSVRRYRATMDTKPNGVSSSTFAIDVNAVTELLKRNGLQAYRRG